MTFAKIADRNGWTFAFQSKKVHEFEPGTSHPAFGIALLWYGPARRLGLSVWSRRASHYIRLCGAE